MKKAFDPLVLLASMALATVAHADCDRNNSPTCMQSALEGADRQLNSVFKSLTASATPEKAQELKAAQKAWLRVRNDTCSLQAGSTSSADWLAKLSADNERASCVYESTMARVRYLQDIPTINHVDELLDKEDYTFPASRASGKLYAEVTMLVGSANTGKSITGLAQIGVTDTKTMVGTQIDFAQALEKATPEGEYTVGVAIDLDNGKFYFTENGQWRAKPGSADGIDLRRGQAYALRVNTPGRTLSRLMSLGTVRINTGSQPFLYATPPGYEPYYKPPAGVAGGSRLDWIIPTYQKVGNKSLSEWADRYWAWLLVKTPQQNPVTDTTGELCGHAQAGIVWFLASADANSHILRSCKVPRGKFLLLPAVANLIRSMDGTNRCAQLESNNASAVGAANIRDVYVAIDGQRFDSLYDNRVHTKGCQTVRGNAGETVVPNIIYFGAWILLQPLPPGEHVITFGGKLDDLKLDREVTYKITVE